MRRSCAGEWTAISATFSRDRELHPAAIAADIVLDLENGVSDSGDRAVADYIHLTKFPRVGRVLKRKIYAID